MTLTSFAITLYGQCCRRHVEGQRVVNDISVVHIVVEVFVACVRNFAFLYVLLVMFLCLYFVSVLYSRPGSFVFGVFY